MRWCGRRWCGHRFVFLPVQVRVVHFGHRGEYSSSPARQKSAAARSIAPRCAERGPSCWRSTRPRHAMGRHVAGDSNTLRRVCASIGLSEDRVVAGARATPAACQARRRGRRRVSARAVAWRQSARCRAAPAVQGRRGRTRPLIVPLVPQDARHDLRALDGRDEAQPAVARGVTTVEGWEFTSDASGDTTRSAAGPRARVRGRPAASRLRRGAVRETRGSRRCPVHPVRAAGTRPRRARTSRSPCRRRARRCTPGCRAGDRRRVSRADRSTCC